ncbi:MAG: glycosyltransferase [Dokdonella sp.]
MSESQPLVSILIRSMDRPTLERALDSAAAQTWPNIEIVVVAACGRRHRSLPDSWKDRPLRFVIPDRDETLTRPVAANACLDAASGEWLNFLDDDDELLPEHVSSLLDAPRPADVRVLYCSARVHDADGTLVGYSGREGFHIQLYNQNRSQPVATLFHRSLIDEGARFDPTYPVYEDQDFFISCATRTAFHWVPSATCIWNGYIGDSGCGLGNNSDTSKHEEYYTRLREKWKDAFDGWKNEPQALMYLGQQHLKSGDEKLALQCLEDALAQLPGDANALNLCGMANFHNGRTERALSLLTEANRRYPNQPAITGNLDLVRARATERAKMH